MQQRLSVPGVQRGFGSGRQTERIWVAAMMMNVVHKRNSGQPRQRQQVARCIGPIIVLDRKTGSRGIGKAINIVCKPSQRCEFVSVCAAPVDIEHVRADSFADRSLILQFRERCVDD